MRKNYIDNIRWISILLLFVYHTSMVWNNFGDQFYVWDTENTVLSDFILFLYPFYMPLLFAIAGISTRYALQKRTLTGYIKERSIRLLLPAAAGTLLTVPVQSFFAEKFHNGYSGNYFESYKLFFTKETEQSDFYGGFSYAHLWFLFYLFVISIVCILIIWLVKKIKIDTTKLKIDISRIKIPFFLIVFLFVFMWLFTPILEVSGKSFGKYFVLFLLGYYVLSNDKIIEKLSRFRFFFLAAFLIINTVHLILFIEFDFNSGSLYNCFVSLTGWLGILAILGIGKRRLDFSNKISSYFSAASLPVYIIHQTVLVALAYYVITYLDTVLSVQFAIIAFGSFIVTIICYEIIKRIPYIKMLFGIKQNKDK